MFLDVKVIEGQIKNLMQQRDEAAIKVQQCHGAISILQEQLQIAVQTHLEQEKEKAQLEAERLKAQAENLEVTDSTIEQGDANGEVKQQEQVEAPQE